MITVQAKMPSPGPMRLINEQLRQGRFVYEGDYVPGTVQAEVSARSRAVGDSQVRAD